MIRKNDIARAAAWLIPLVVVVVGACKSTDVIAPKDSTMTLTANPNRAVFDPDNPIPVRVYLSAQVLAAGGYPQAGVAVTFSSTAGVLASRGATVTTNSNSVAEDVLTVPVEAPSSIDVTATSGTLTQTVPIAKVVGNPPPSDGTIAMSANPASAILNTVEGPFALDVAIVAQVRDKTGYPVPGVTVRFSTDTGVLDTLTATADVNGIAETTLTLTVDDPEGNGQVKVIASSPPLSQTLTIAFNIVTPTAAMAPRTSPNGIQRAGTSGAVAATAGSGR